MVRDDGTDVLNFDWASGSPSTSCGLGADSFSARWTRTVNFSGGNYQFTVTADDGVRLWIDSQLVLDKWILQAPTTYTVGPLSLSGNKTLKMEYFENAGGAVAKLSWQEVSPPPPPPPPPTGKSKLTIHTGFTGGESMLFIEQAKPTTVKILDNFGQAAVVKQKSPNTQILGRIWYDDRQRMNDGNPEDRAQEWWNNVKGIILANSAVDYWEGYNEPEIPNATVMSWYARFEKKRVEILAANGKKACIGNFSTGVPDVNDPTVWPAFYPAIDAAMANGGVMGLHEYSAPTMDWLFDPTTGEGWLTGRYRKVYRQNLTPAGREIPLVITECGIDGGVRGEGGRGWKSYQTPENYFNQLKWYDSILKEDSYVLGATIFCLEIPNWYDFDIAGQVRELLTDYVKGSEPSPSPTPPPDLVWDPRLDQLNIRLEPAAVGAGQPYWRLIEALYRGPGEPTPPSLPGGDHHIYLEVIDESGNRIVGQRVIVQNGGTATLVIGNNPYPEYGANFPMYGMLGSYTAWVEGLPSDKVVGMGLPMNQHVTFYLTFQRATR
jgi:hypothetical protein